MGRTARRRYKRKLSPSLCVNLGSDPYFIQLSQWLSRNGWSPTCKLALANFSNTGRGLKTEQNLISGCTIISIPTKLMITTTTVANSDIGWIFQRSFLLEEFTTQQVLATFLIWERNKGNNSPWAPYLKTVPSHFSTPAFCNTAELSCLPKFLSEYIGHQKDNIVRGFQSLSKLIASERVSVPEYVSEPHEGAINEDSIRYFNSTPSKEVTHLVCLQEHSGRSSNSLLNVFNYEDFLWAWFAVNSRCVFLKNETKTVSNCIQTSDEDCLALAPFLDMFNHSNESKVKACLNENCQSYELQTMVPFKKHSQVFIHYGSHPNSKLFIDYGFFLPENVHDSIELDFDDVSNAVKLAFPLQSDCPASKYTFIKWHSLKKDLWLNFEGLSFNTSSLIYVFLSTDGSNRSLTQKIFSSSFDCNERLMINTVGTILIDTKITEFENVLKSMGNISDCSESFKVAKGLIREYINVLKRSKLCLE